MKIGDTILVPRSLDDPSGITEHVITKVMKDSVQCGSPEMVFYSAFCWPIEVKDELIKILETRRALKKQFDDSMGLIYELKNKIVREQR